MHGEHVCIVQESLWFVWCVKRQKKPWKFMWNHLSIICMLSLTTANLSSAIVPSLLSPANLSASLHKFYLTFATTKLALTYAPWIPMISSLIMGYSISTLELFTLPFHYGDKAFCNLDLHPHIANDAH